MIKAPVSRLLWLLAIVLIFQVSVLPDTLELKAAGRAINAGVLLVFFALTVRALLQKRTSRVWMLFILPAGLVLAGYAVNILRSTSGASLGYAGLLLPWLAALSVPLLRSCSLDQFWLLFYRFMLLFALVAGVEYAAVLTGVLNPTFIETSRGDFFRGVFTIFHRLSDDSPYDRMYGVFPEPGTFAMLLMPAIAYGLVFSKKLGTLVFLACLFSTRSLGGFASLVIVLALFSYWRARHLPGRAVLVLLLGATAAYFFLGFFVDSYGVKVANSTTREDNIYFFFADSLGAFWRYPFGSPLSGESLSAIQDADQLYAGSNFAPYTALIIGGIAAFMGYVTTLAVALQASIRFFISKGTSDNIMACAFISLPALLLFVVQRQTIFDSALFAFLFAPAIIATFRGGPVKSAAWRPGNPRLLVGRGRIAYSVHPTS